MPTVGLYGPRQVSTDALPGVRRTAAETPGSMGAGLALEQGRTADAWGQVGQEVERVGRGLAGQAIADRQAATQAAKAADETAAWEADNVLGTWENQRLYDPQQGALLRKGKAAMPLPEEVGAEYRTLVNQTAAGLATPAQRDHFLKRASTRGLQLDLTLRRHVAGEMQAHEASTLEALLANKRDEAVHNAADPLRVGLALKDAVDAYTSAAPRLGIDGAQLDHELGKIRTATHIGVVETLLAQKNPIAAATYFAANEDQIVSGQPKDHLREALKEGDVRQRSQRRADAILAKDGTLTEQREEARGITDPEERDAVMQRLEHEAVVRKTETREREETTLRSVYDVVDRTRDVTRIPPATWAALDGSTRSALRGYAKNLAAGTPTETDLGTYYGFLQQAGSDPAAFMHTNLLQARHKLDEGDFKHLAQLQLSLRAGDRSKVEKDLGDFRTRNDLVQETLWQYTQTKEKDYTPAQLNAKSNLLRQMETWTAAEQADGRKVTNAQVQEHLDDLLSRKATIPGSWWALWAPRTYDLRARDATVMETTYTDIAPAERDDLERALRASHRPVSPQTVLDLYLAIKTGPGTRGK